MAFEVKELVLSFERQDGGLCDVELRVDGDKATQIAAKLGCGRTPPPDQEPVPVTNLKELKNVLRAVLAKIPDEPTV